MDALSRGTVAAFAQPPNVKISPAVPETVTVCVYRFETIPLPVRCSAFVSNPPRVSPAAFSTFTAPSVPVAAVPVHVPEMSAEMSPFERRLTWSTSEIVSDVSPICTVTDVVSPVRYALWRRELESSWLARFEALSSCAYRPYSACPALLYTAVVLPKLLNW